MKIPWEEIEELTKYLKDKGLSEISIETKDGKLSVKKDINCTYVPQVISAPQLDKPASKEKAPTHDSKLYEVTSPMVGTFYAASSPGSEPFVKAGKKVKQGNVLCIIEAMKIMNELPSEVNGTVTEILVKDNQTVEFGQVLMRIKPD